MRRICVPAYAYALDQGGRLTLTTTLMIHHVSAREITIHSVRYYDAAGALVHGELDAPRVLEALETLEFRQEPGTTSGGAGRLTFTSRGVEVGAKDPSSERSGETP